MATGVFLGETDRNYFEEVDAHVRVQPHIHKKIICKKKLTRSGQSGKKIANPRLKKIKEKMKERPRNFTVQ